MPDSSTKNRYSVKLNLIDRIVNAISPSQGLQRIRSKMVLNAMENSGYVIPAGPKRSMRDWRPPSQTADQDILPKQSSLRAGSRDLYMNNTIAGAVLERIKTNSLGWGLTLQSRVDRTFLKKTLGLTDERLSEIEYDIEREFSLWGNTVNCDASRHFWFSDLQVLSFFNVLLSGDVFASLIDKERIDSPINLCINIIESDMVSNPNLQMDTNRIAGGVEVDGDDEAIRYWFRKPNPNFMMQFGPSLGDKWTAVNRYDPSSNRRQVIHLYFKERPGQRRGVPFLAPLFQEVNKLARLSQSELDAAIVNSFFTVFVQSSMPDAGGLGEGYYPDMDGGNASSIIDSSASEADKVYEMGSGNIIDMDVNEKIEVADPKRPNQKFEPFYLAIVKQIGARTGVPFEVLISHFSSSYSASRGAILEAWKLFRCKRIWTVRYFNSPIYEEVITDLVLANRLDLPGFMEDIAYRAAWLGAAWNGISQGQLDPLKETKAFAQQVDYTFTTREDVHAKLTEDGVSDWESTLDRAARERVALESRGLLNTSTPSTTDTSIQSEDETEDQTIVEEE